MIVPYVLHILAVDSTETISDFENEEEGRRAWLAAVAQSARYAGLTRTSGDPLMRLRCERSARSGSATYSFTDRTEAHAAELMALAERLTAEGPAGFRIERRDDRLVILGGSREHHVGDVEETDAARLEMLWQAYVPAMPAFAAHWRRLGMPGQPHVEQDGTISVAVESWETRVFYWPSQANGVLAMFPSAPRSAPTEQAPEGWGQASDEDEQRICEALAAHGYAVARTESL